MEIDTSLEGSLSQFGPDGAGAILIDFFFTFTDLPGVSNYWLPIYTNSSETEIAVVLYFLATSDSGCETTSDGDGCVSVSYDQVKKCLIFSLLSSKISWYKNISSITLPRQPLFIHASLHQNTSSHGNIFYNVVSSFRYQNLMSWSIRAEIRRKIRCSSLSKNYREIDIFPLPCLNTSNFIPTSLSCH